MKALTLTRFQKKRFDAVQLMQIEQPRPQAHQVVVRMKAAAFNPADLQIASGAMKMMSPTKPPFVLGVDGAGIIEELGASVRDWSVGDEVFFYTGLVHTCTMSEYAAVNADALARKPAHWSFAQAAAAALALLCADLALTRADVRTGQRVLIHGGGGSVGATALMLARARGAVTETTASNTDAGYLQSLGVATVYDYKTCPLHELPKSAYDMVLDGMGGNMFMHSLPLLKRGGCIASLKVMTGLDDMMRMGMQPPALVKLLMPLMFRKFTKAASKAGVRLAGVATYANGPRLAELGGQTQALGYAPRIAETFTLNDAARALELFSQGKSRGKVVVEM